VKKRLRNGGSSTPSICTSSWLSASEPPPIMPPGIMKPWTFRVRPRQNGGSGSGAGDAREAKSFSRQARDSRMRSPLEVSAPIGPWKAKS